MATLPRMGKSPCSGRSPVSLKRWLSLIGLRICAFICTAGRQWLNGFGLKMYLKRFEELWSSEHGQPYMICLLTSASIIADGLYMFHASAHQAAEIYPELSRIALEKIAAANPRNKFGISEHYGFLEIFAAPHGIGLFQVSVHF